MPSFRILLAVVKMAQTWQSGDLNFPTFKHQVTLVRETVVHNELILLQRLANSDKSAFTELYEAYFPVLYQHALKLLKTKQAAEDVCNEVFLNLWQNRASVSGIQSLNAYLFTAVRNRSINLLKSFARSQAAMAEIKKTFPGHGIDAEAQYLSKEYIAFVREGIAALPTRAKEVFTLCRVEGLSYDEVATQLGISRDAVKGHMVASMKKLKTYLQKDLGISFLVTAILLAGQL